MRIIDGGSVPFRRLKIKRVNGCQYVIEQLMNIMHRVNTNRIGRRRNKRDLHWKNLLTVNFGKI